LKAADNSDLSSQNGTSMFFDSTDDDVCVTERHGDSFNMLWIDGHVSFSPYNLLISHHAGGTSFNPGGDNEPWYDLQ